VCRPPQKSKSEEREKADVFFSSSLVPSVYEFIQSFQKRQGKHFLTKLLDMAG
jgi:TorA maturation chaperone TorD